jgi:hypothetical protein
MAEQSGALAALLGDGTPAPGETYGVMGMFETPAELFHACEKLRDKGYLHFDAQTPFPVHGLEKAMGLKPSRIPFLSLMGGATGLASGLALTYYCNFDYPLNIAGKPPFSWQIYIPIYFELTILLTALTTFVALWAMCGLPRFFHPTMTHKSFHRTTTDGFFLVVEAKDPKFNLGKVTDLLTSLGAKDVEEVLA